MEELLKKMPIVMDDGVTLESKTTIAYLVDGISGRLIHVYKSNGDDNYTNAMVKPTNTENFVKLQLLITRTDSKLEHFHKTTRKLALNVTVSHFKAELLCDPVFNSGNELGPEIQTGIYMPLQCGNGLSLSSTRAKEFRKLQEQHRQSSTDVFGKVFKWSLVKLLVPLVLIGVVVSVFIKSFSSRGNDFNSKSGPSKKKKNRKSGKDGITNGQRDRQTVPSNRDQFELVEGGQMLLGFNNFLSSAANGRKIGKLFVSSKEIAKGSNGTVVFEGIYEGRPVAVKRLLRSHHEVAFKEIQNLIASDQHSNIIRWYGVEYDQDFVYLSLERCTCNLDDLIKSYLEFSMTNILGNKESMDPLEGFIKGNNFWKVGGHPSPLMLKLMRLTLTLYFLYLDDYLNIKGSN